MTSHFVKPRDPTPAPTFERLVSNRIRASFIPAGHVEGFGYAMTLGISHREKDTAVLDALREVRPFTSFVTLPHLNA